MPLPCIEFYWASCPGAPPLPCRTSLPRRPAARRSSTPAAAALRCPVLPRARLSLPSPPDAHLRTATPAPQAVFRPEVVQIWVDNLADLYGNVNLVAADLLSR